MISPVPLQEAHRRLQSRVVQTPLTYDPELDVYLKWENRQTTGSFKIRGALNKVLSLDRSSLERGLVTVSAGNHGQGVAIAARQAGVPLLVFVSDHAVPAKLEAMRALGAELRLVPGGYAEAERAALAFVAQGQATWISPYNDLDVIAGQGTLALELAEQLPAPQELRAIVTPAGGGGLVSGIGAVLRHAWPVQPRPRLVAVQSEASPYLHELFHRGTQDDVVEHDSLADGLAGAVEPGSITIDLARQWVDDFYLLSEESIARAIAFAWQRYGEVIEGSAAVALAAVSAEAQAAGVSVPRPAAVILSGGNIQPEVHARVLAQWAADSPEGGGG